VEEYCKVRGLKVVGFYHANERLEDKSLSKLATTIGEQLVSAFPQAVIMLVQNDKLSPECREMACDAYCFASSDWKKQASTTAQLSESFNWEQLMTLARLNADGTGVPVIDMGGECVVDFDDHFDDVRMDWRNTHIK
jgi:hypothetical protein